jgi:acetyltransferase-like isoleucine patch superfamily enzyme
MSQHEDWARLFADVHITGADNELIARSVRASNCAVRIKGDGNRVVVGDDAILRDFRVAIEGNGCTLELGTRCRIVGHIMQKGAGALVRVGARATFERVSIVCIEGRSVVIGQDCMFSYGVEVRTSDAHPLLDLVTRERVNPPGDLFIGDHVWVGAHATVLKGVRIADDCVVGTRAVVVRDVAESHCAVAGVPARVVRQGVTWARDLVA